MNLQVATRALREIDACFSKIILNSNFDIRDDEISWIDYREGIDKGIAYAAVYQRLIDTKQYSFLLQDSSFIQIYFHWEANQIKKAKLAYYPTPVKISGAIDDLLESAEHSGVDLLEELYFGAESWIERGIDVVNTSYLRLDYDSGATNHAKCHIQIASLNELRIASKYLLNPFNFFTWIVEHLKFDGINDILASQRFIRSLSYHRTRNHDAQEEQNHAPFLSNLNT
jgi:hypothetical protein